MEKTSTEQNGGGGVRPGEVILRSIFDTQGLTPRQALTSWYEHIDVMFDARVHKAESGTFRARLDAFMLNDIVLVDAHVGGQSYDRSRKRIGRDGIDHYLLQFYMKGSVARRDEKGERTRTHPGDLWVSDLGQPILSVAEDADMLNLFVPRRLLSPLLETPDEHSMRILPGDAPLVALFRDHLQGLARMALSMTVDDAAQVRAPTLQLAAAALNGAAGREDVRSGVETTLCDAICRYVCANLPGTGMTREHVAGHFGISVRKLDYLFASKDGFASWVREERLARVYDALRDQRQMHERIEDIANAHGFSHKANLGRAFRAYYGLTPGQVRSLARERLTEADPKDRDSPEFSAWRRWIAAM